MRLIAGLLLLPTLAFAQLNNINSEYSTEDIRKAGVKTMIYYSGYAGQGQEVKESMNWRSEYRNDGQLASKFYRNYDGQDSVTFRNHYDQKGGCIKSTFSATRPKTNRTTLHVVKYDNRSRLTLDSTRDVTFAYAYDTNGVLIWKSRRQYIHMIDRHNSTYSYTSEGKLKSIVTLMYRDNIYAGKIEEEFDEQGRELLRICSNVNGHITDSTAYVYDAAGVCVLIRREMWQKRVYEKQLKSMSDTVYSFTQFLHTQEGYGMIFTYEITETYNRKAQLMECREISHSRYGDELAICTYEYDSRGNLTFRKEVEPRRTQTKRWKYVYY